MIKGSKAEDIQLLRKSMPSIRIYSLQRRKIKGATIYRYNIKYNYDHDSIRLGIIREIEFGCIQGDLVTTFYNKTIRANEN